MHLFASAFHLVKQLLLLNTNLIKCPDFYIPSNDREQQNYLGGYGLSFRNIEEHKHIDKRLYTNIERMTLNIWFSRL